MTEEQIKQYAEDYIDENTQGVIIDANIRNFLLDVYLAGAHSRDKEIEELKKKLEDNKHLQDELVELCNKKGETV